MTSVGVQSGDFISTHTPLAGRDGGVSGCGWLLPNFYSHAPRGARQFRPALIAVLLEISTHTPLAGRDNKDLRSTQSQLNFYSHAPRGARPHFCKNKASNRQFLLTRPSRGATSAYPSLTCPKQISTHTPLAGRDRKLVRLHSRPMYFYSHAPRGARQDFVGEHSVYP